MDSDNTSLCNNNGNVSFEFASYKYIDRACMFKPYHELLTLLCGAGLLSTILFLWWVLTIFKPRLQATGPYNYLALEHILVEYFYIINILLYNFIDYEDIQSIIYIFYYSFDVLLTLTTASFSVLLLFKLFYQRDVTKKGVTLFLTIAVALLEIFEELISCFSLTLSSDVRFSLVAILLLISCVIFILYPLVSCKNDSLSTSVTLYFLSTLLVLLLSDIFFVFYNIYTTTVYGNVFAIILVLSIVLQIIWCDLCQIVFKSFLRTSTD